MRTALLIFPHQLFEHHPGLDENPDVVILSEDPLFFGDRVYPSRFHKQKLLLHRASMKSYEALLEKQGCKVWYQDYVLKDSFLNKIFDQLRSENIKHLHVADVVDDILFKRLTRESQRANITLNITPSPGWLNTKTDNQNYRAGKKRWFMADFYKWQRQRFNILMEDRGPVGGQWSFDEDNRKKVPKTKLSTIPALNFPSENEYIHEARDYVTKHFPNHPGAIDKACYPINHTEAKGWYDDFLRKRFHDFGPYEDAIVAGENWLWHSVLTPMLNIGLLTPQYVVDKALKYAEHHEVRLSSLEGFIRQVIGWREFMRGTYEDLGVQMRTTNAWRHSKPLPKAFYDGSTGVDLVDDVIKRVLETGYCHHIERLMVLGGFMFLCEINPDDIYQWFMDMFVDSYDWVMVPNVYAMSQNADGGLITTKPYFSGSNYIKKMSHYKHAPWADIWDGLYWRWILKNAEELQTNPRWAMMVRMAQRMDLEKKEKYKYRAEAFLNRLFS